jgi:hypothetical protein
MLWTGSSRARRELSAQHGRSDVATSNVTSNEHSPRWCLPTHSANRRQTGDPSELQEDFRPQATAPASVSRRRTGEPMNLIKQLFLANGFMPQYLQASKA